MAGIKYIVVGKVKRIGSSKFKKQDLSIPLSKAKALEHARLERASEIRRRKNKLFAYQKGLRIKNIRVESK